MKGPVNLRVLYFLSGNRHLIPCRPEDFLRRQKQKLATDPEYKEGKRLAQKKLYSNFENGSDSYFIKDLIFLKFLVFLIFLCLNNVLNFK